MSAKDLITLSRAYQALQGISGQDSLVSTLITAASDAVEKYCCRYFLSHAYDELYNGNGDRRLILRQYPIQSIQSVRYRPVTVLKIINNNVTQNQQVRLDHLDRLAMLAHGLGFAHDRDAADLGYLSNPASFGDRRHSARQRLERANHRR